MENNYKQAFWCVGEAFVGKSRKGCILGKSARVYKTMDGDDNVDVLLESAGKSL